MSQVLFHMGVNTSGNVLRVGGGGALPVRGVLVQFIKLPVHRVHIHMVVLLKVPQEKLNGVVSSQEPLLIQVNFLHLRLRREKVFREAGKCLGIVNSMTEEKLPRV